MPHPLSTTCPRSRWAIERFVLLLIAVLLLRTWYLEGLFMPCLVTGGSMAPTLVGLHREVSCGDCGHRFDCGSDLRPVGPRAVCPNCDHAGNDLSGLPDVDGDRVLIGKSIFRVRGPQRWEVVAFRPPWQADKIHVKRVVGLPGESIRILGGDVLVDGQIQRKSLWQQRAMAVLVHDANRQPVLEPAPPLRWQGEREDSQWLSDAGRFGHPPTAEEEPIDWLVYRHWSRVPGRPGKIREGPITNQSGYNQTRPRRHEDTHPVNDLMLSFRLKKTDGPGRLVVKAIAGRNEFEVSMYPGRGRFEVLQNGRRLPSGSGQLPDWSDALTVEVSLFDQQFLLAFDGRTAFPPWPYGRSAPVEDPVPRPLAIGSQGLDKVEICDLRVYRDVYYTHPIGPGGRRDPAKTYELAADEYFVVGDNNSISEDSRTWPDYALDAKLLIGKPLLVHFPAKRISLGRWVFQVPDPAKIRYIR